jgi:hypothetical protein
MVPATRVVALLPRLVLAALLALVLVPLAAQGSLPRAHAASTWTVTTATDDLVPAACTGTTCITLRDALGAAQPGDTITFAPGWRGSSPPPTRSR